ncbi:MgtC/SapB family protein, partial [Streptococcus pneumoniae]|nr:MgtC/SapB family protein [Streptococcus pneumoniae]
MTATSLGLSNIEIVVRIVLSVVIGSIIGLERGSKSQPAGIRTYSIVCL